MNNENNNYYLAIFACEWYVLDFFLRLASEVDTCTLWVVPPATVLCVITDCLGLLSASKMCVALTAS